jgi:hypothetical protein
MWALCGPLRAVSYLLAHRARAASDQTPLAAPALHFAEASFVDTVSRDQTLIAECLLQHKQSLEKLLQLDAVELREPLQATVCEFDAALEALSRIALQQKSALATGPAQAMAGAA